MQAGYSKRRTSQFSLRFLLIVTLAIACGSAIYRVYGISSLPSLAGLLGTSFGMMIARFIGEERVFPALFGFGVGAVLGTIVFDYSQPLIETRWSVSQTLLIAFTFVLLASLWDSYRTRRTSATGR